jgi:DNA-binding transcriptional regulator YiaG
LPKPRIAATFVGPPSSRMISLSVMATLNTMFKENANTMFNNTVFSYAIIRGMKKPEHITEVKAMAPQAQRLYRAAKELRGVEGKSAVARLLNVSPQNITHWEDGRDISFQGLLAAQEKIGCDAVWLRDGVGDMVKGGGKGAADLEDLMQLIGLFWQSSARGRQQILRAAKGAEKRDDAASGGFPLLDGRSSNN